MSDIPLKPFPHGKPFKTSALSATDVLMRARIALAPRGAWKKGGYKGDHGSRCLVQTINDCDGKHAEDAKKIALTAIKQVTGKTYSSIPNFNDAQPTQKHHVLAVLDKAIEIAKKGTTSGNS